MWTDVKKHGKRVWHFFWKEDSLASWIANLLIAFIVIRYVVYPLLGIALGTSFPIVAVISGSMEHSTAGNQLCGQEFPDFLDSYDNYWDICGSWYENRDISKEEFRQFPMRNGFDKGDVIILWRAEDIRVGDVLIFQGDRPQPLIHRVVKKFVEDDQVFLQTKGDHNAASISAGIGETKISQERIYGKGILRIPYLGWVKILFVDAVRPLGIIIER